VADERGRVQEQTRPLLRRGAACAVRPCRHHVFSVRARSGLPGSSAAKSNSSRFSSSTNSPYLIRAGLPILGSLQMLAKNQKNAHFAAQLDDISTPRQDGESLSAAFEAQTGFPGHVHHHLLAGERSGNCRK